MAQRLLKLLNSMSGKFQKFSLRKFVSKKRKDRRLSQESVPYVKQKDTSTWKTGYHRRQSNWSDGDISLIRQDGVAVGAGPATRHCDASGSGNRYEQKFDHSSGSKKGVNVPGDRFSSVISSVEDLSQLMKRRSKTQEPKPSSVIDEPLSYMDAMSRNLKEATWAAANTSPFVYQKSVSTPCMGMKKVKPTSGFDGMAIGWPNLRTCDVPGPKARFPASGVGPVHVPSNNKINGISMSWNNTTLGVANNNPPLSSDSRTAINNRAKKLFALKLITGEIWNPEHTSAPYIVDQEISDNLQAFKLNSLPSKTPASQKDHFQDKARKSLVDTLKKVASSHSQPSDQTLKLRVQTNLERNKNNFSKQIRPPTVGASRAYSETNNIYLTKLKNSEQKVPRYRPMEKQVDKGLNSIKVSDKTAPILGKVSSSVAVNTAPKYKIMSNVLEPNPITASKIEQKNLPKSSDSDQPFFEKGGIRKVSAFVWQKLKKMSELASSNLKQSSVTSAENVGKEIGIEKPKVKKVSDATEQNLKHAPDVNTTNIKNVKDLPGQELKTVTEFARPIPKYVYEFLKPTQKNLPEFPRPIPKNVGDLERLTMKRIPGPIFENERGYVWSKSNKLSKFADPNLKTYEITETTIKKFPYFEVVNIKKEYDFQLPNAKKEFDIVRPNVGNQHDLSQTIIKDSKFTESKHNSMPVFSEKIPAKAHGPTSASNYEIFPEKGDSNLKKYNFAAINVKKESERARMKFENAPGVTETLEHTVAERNLQKRPEFGRQILNKVPKIEKLSDTTETISAQSPDRSEPNVIKESELQNPENMSQHSEQNLNMKEELINESEIEGKHSEQTFDLDGTKLENTPDLDQLNLKKLPVSPHLIKQSEPKFSFSNATNKVGVLNQISSVMSDKERNSLLHSLRDTTTQITNKNTGETLNIISKVSGEIQNKPPDCGQQERESSWKIYVVHNAQGKGSNPGSSRQQNASGSLTGTEAPINPANYSPESQSSKTLKKMMRNSHNPPSTSNGCTESLMTRRKLKSANLQNYPPPQMFNRMERGENKFLIFWKGRGDTDIFSNPNKKQSLLVTPPSPRRTFSQNDANSHKSLAECEASDDESLWRMKSPRNVKRAKSESCMPSQDCSSPGKSSEAVSKFLPVVCEPSKNLPCVVSNSNTSPLNDDPEDIE